MRNALLAVVDDACAQTPGETALRIRLAADVPAVRARMTEKDRATGEMLTRTLAERTGRPGDDLALQVLTGALLGGVRQAMYHWAGPGHREHLADVVARAFDVLERGLGPERPSVPQ